MFELPHPSVAIHVRVMVYSWAQPPAVVTSVKITEIDGSQTSVAVALPVLPGAELAEHSMVVLAGQDMAGGVVSSTVII